MTDTWWHWKTTLHPPSVWCCFVYLSTRRLCIVCGWEALYYFSSVDYIDRLAKGSGPLGPDALRPCINPAPCPNQSLTGALLP
jgi:hypothetical protein